MHLILDIGLWREIALTSVIWGDPIAQQVTGDALRMGECTLCGRCLVAALSLGHVLLTRRHRRLRVQGTFPPGEVHR
jgi:hypothetical protein